MLPFSANLLFLLLHDGGAGGRQAAALPGADDLGAAGHYSPWC